MRRSFRLLAVAGLLLATAGCAQYNLGPTAFTAPGDIREAQAARARTPFNEALRKDYLALATDERAEGDWRDAGFFAQQAVAAAHDQTPQPWPLSRWELPPEHVQQFNTGRAALVAALDGGGREKAPVAAAKAQTSFECWAEEQEENFQFDEIKACWKAFQSSLAEVQEAIKTVMKPMPEPPARDYLVFFDFDKSAIRSDAAGILNRVAAAVKALKVRMVDLIGHTDRAGTVPYNQRLSERRAESVRHYLSRHGVPNREMHTSGRGELDPRVPTPDGVREQENRRVEIHLR